MTDRPSGAADRSTADTSGDRRTAGFVQSLERGLAVIRAFDGDHSGLTLAEVARSTGLDRAAARRFLYTLVDLGYIRAEGRLFSLRPKTLELGYAYLSSLGLPDIAQPYLKVLAEQARESSYLSILDGDEVVCVGHVPVRRIWTASIDVGTRLPAFATGSGRVLLAALPQDELDRRLAGIELRTITPFTTADPARLREEIATVRAQGWALIDQELEVGLRVVAAPVHERGDVVGAVSLSTLAAGSSVQATKDLLLPPLRSAVEAISEDLASRPGPR